MRFQQWVSTAGLSLLLVASSSVPAYSQSGGGSGARPSYPPARSYQPPPARSQGSGSQGSGTQGTGGQAYGVGGSGGSFGAEGSDSLALAGVALGLRGYCPVSLSMNKKWVAGDPRFTAVYDDHAYRFPSARAKQIFLADPVRYTPALGGDNVVDYAKTGRRTQGDLSQGIVHRGRLYFVGTQQERAEFLSDPASFADADLTLGGDCVVCRVRMSQAMPGSPQLTVIHDGLRYQFAGLEQQKMFLTSPASYTTAALRRSAQGRGGDAGSESRPQGSGTQGSETRGSGLKPNGSGSGSR